MSSEHINYGVLNPKTTLILGHSGGHHVLLRGQAGDRIGDTIWPYAPEVLQRRDNSFAAVLGLVVRPNVEADKIRELFTSPDMWDFFRAINRLKCLRLVETILDLEVILVKTLRPGAYNGVEWNASGGSLKPGEEVTIALCREQNEELGMKMYARSCLAANLQFAAGSYREWYSFYVVLATGEPVLSKEEGILEWDRVNIPFIARWCGTPFIDLDDTPTDYCGIDGKVVMAAMILKRQLRERGIF